MTNVDPFIRALLERYTGEDKKTLDVGCGSGGYRGAAKGNYVGVDITAAPYAPGVPRAVDVVTAARLLPFETGVFDLVMSKSAFYQMPDHSATLGEFHRVLKLGGRLLLIDYNRRTQQRLKENATLPCWTQWQLRSLVHRNGFNHCQFLAARVDQPGPLALFFRIPLQELFGTWAIVTATKSAGAGASHG